MKNKKILYIVLATFVALLTVIIYIHNTIKEFKKDIKSTQREYLKIPNYVIKLDKSWLVLSDKNPYLITSMDGKINLRISSGDYKFSNYKLINDLKKRNVTAEKNKLLFQNKQVECIVMRQKINGKESESYITGLNKLLIFIDIDYDNEIGTNREKVIHFLNNNIVLTEKVSRNGVNN